MSEETNSPPASDLSPQDGQEDSQKELEKLKEINTQQTNEIEQLKSQVDEFQNTAKQSLTVPPEKTQGVKPPRSGAASVLQSVAKKAAASNSRSDVHEYMRLRRNFV